MRAEECGCGGMDGVHLLGQLNCYREWVRDEDSPIELKEGEYGSGQYLVGGHVITGFSLFEQRRYHKHENGRWSRPKDHDSTNSITA